jgi:hypothetical protein
MWRGAQVRLGVVAPVVALLWAGPLAAQRQATAENVPTIQHESVPDFLKFPDDIFLGETMGVARNSQGHLFVYTRSGDTRLFEFDQNGNYVREIGEGLYGFEFAHKVRVDPQDNIWAVDEGTNMVIRFNPAGRVTMVLGSRPPVVEGVVATPTGARPPDEKYLFARPTDVTWDAQGNIFVTDGYYNHRIVKYDANGRFVKQVGAVERGSGPDQLNTPHTVASDERGNVYVGDRGNARVQVFDNDLNLIATYDNVGNPWEICISPGPHQYLFVSNSNPDSNPAASWDITGEVYKMELDGTIIGKFGSAGKALGQFQTIHGMDCRDPNELIISEITAFRVQKVRLGPDPQTTSAR